MATELQIKATLRCLAEAVSCFQCGCRIRLGDQDCPHCGADLEEPLRQWAEYLLEQLDDAASRGSGG